jgi:hypothetical protein
MDGVSDFVHSKDDQVCHPCEIFERHQLHRCSFFEMEIAIHLQAKCKVKRHHSHDANFT